MKKIDSSAAGAPYRQMPKLPSSRQSRKLVSSRRLAAKTLSLSAGAVALATQIWSQRASAQFDVAGQLLIDLRATDPSAGTAAWQNFGTLGGSFAEVGDASTVVTGGVSYVSLGANEAYRGPVAPASITGAEDRSIEVWMRQATIATEDTMVAWGHRGGPEGTNLAFNTGSNAVFGAVGHWGAPDMGWNGTPAADQLHHLVYTYDGTTANVYADGVLKNSRAVALNTHAFLTDTINLQAQNNAAGGLEFISSDGYELAVLRVHSEDLTAAQVQNNFLAGVPEPASAGLLVSSAGLLAFRRRRLS